MDECHTVAIGIGELFVTKEPTIILAALGLGSCVGIVVYDPLVRAGGLAHAMLPSGVTNGASSDCRYVDVSIKKLLSDLAALGASPRRLQCKLVGGAQLPAVTTFTNGQPLGVRNVIAAVSSLRERGIVPNAMEVGGKCGRSVRLFVNSGRVLMRLVGQTDVDI